MMSHQEALTTYQAMTGLTAQMVDAAGSSDWERLALLEQECSACVERLKQCEPAAAMQGAEREQKVRAIRTMLEHDRMVRDLVSPWMARLAALLNNGETERRLARAYGG
jgi:flagellar protein FliT